MIYFNLNHFSELKIGYLEKENNSEMKDERPKKRIKIKKETQEIKQKLESFSDNLKNQESIKDDLINLNNLEKNAQQKHDSHPDSWDPESTCWGCREGQPNQLAHMDPGGCLHSEESDHEQ